MPKTAATRTTKNSRNRATLCLAFELSLKVWKLAFATSLGGKQLIRDIPSRDLGRSSGAIDKALRHFRLASTTAVVSCYEVGRDGFWLHRFTNRIKGLLIGQGLYLEKLPNNFPGWLPQVRLWDGSAIGPELQRRLGREYALWIIVDRQIEDLDTQQRRALRHDLAKEQARRLIELKGVGPLSAWTLVHEIFGWREIRNRRQLGGLRPVPHQSGDEDHSLGIPKAGIKHVRLLAIELAWRWIRHQPESALSQWYEARFARGGGRARKIGIVAVARKLLIALWRWLEHGVLPEGTQLKAVT